jgi:hypothetical protein
MKWRRSWTKRRMWNMSRRMSGRSTTRRTRRRMCWTRMRRTRGRRRRRKRKVMSF